MRLIKYFYVLSLLLLLSCVTGKVHEGEGAIDYKLYQGKWYEIARLPNPFEEGLNCITMNYEVHDEGIMMVTNKGYNKNDPSDIKILTGKAWIPDGKEPQKIKIQFIWPITKDYILIHIDNTKGLAILGSPTKYQLWILSRSPKVAEEDIQELIKIAQKNGYRTDTLVYVDQNCKE